MKNSPHISSPFEDQLNQDRFGSRVAVHLSEAADNLPRDITERLRVARVQALGARKTFSVQTARGLVGAAGAVSLSFGNEHHSSWQRIAALLPLLALLIGLFAIQVIQNDARVNEMAEVDSALLTDELPPGAFTDPGFTQFLKSQLEQQ